MVPEGIGIFRFPPSRLFSSQLRSARSQLLGQAPSGEGFLFPFDKRDGFQGNYRA